MGVVCIKGAYSAKSSVGRAAVKKYSIAQSKKVVCGISMRENKV